MVYKFLIYRADKGRVMKLRAFRLTLCALLAAAHAFAPVSASMDDVPLRIEIETALDFSRVALSGTEGGRVALDVESGARRTSGAITNLGGLALRGTARLIGKPMAAVRVDLPARITLRSNTGATAEITSIKSTLSPAPMLGPDGQLQFQFSGELIVKGPVSGSFRGSIAISADYE